MKIVDAQIHIWSQTVTPPSGLHRKVERFTAEEALKEMDEAGVDAALIHPPYSWDPDSGAMALEAAQKYPDRFAVMGQFSLTDPNNRDRIKAGASSPA
jgi:predicted TIM-barrel fold metal-dependent hydrolase